MHTCPMVTAGTLSVAHVGGPNSPRGCPTVLISNMLAARLGDMTAYGDVRTVDRPTVMIG